MFLHTETLDQIIFPTTLNCIKNAMSALAFKVLYKERMTHWINDSFSTYAKFSQKLTFLTPSGGKKHQFSANFCVRTKCMIPKLS